jgi:hypothetical protein
MGMIEEWFRKYSIPFEAQVELRLMFISHPRDDESPADGTEGDVQNLIRIHAAEIGDVLWRNNSGATTDDAGNFFRFGLGNDSTKLNKVYKSPDLVGVRRDGKPMFIEVKEPGWRWTGNKREQGQLNFLTHAASFGALCGFAQSVEDFLHIRNRY